MSRHADGVATSGLADGWNIDGGAAMAADHVLAILAIAFGAADAASIERRAPAIGLFDDHEADGLACADIGREKMHGSVLDLAKRNAKLIALSDDRRDRRR